MRSLLFFALMLAATCLPAQTTKDAIEARLLHRPLYLRGCWQNDTLSFDSSGVLLSGDNRPTSFTLSGIEISKLSLASDHLSLEGRRVGLILDNFTTQRIVLKVGKRFNKDEPIRIEIAAPPAGDYEAAIEAIFSDLQGMVPDLPPSWQGYARAHLLAAANSQQAYGAPHPQSLPSRSLAPKSEEPRRVGGSVTPPKVLNAPEPSFSEEAKGVKHAGKCLVYLQVDHDGMPTKISILHASGLGLDERAMSAVASYRFTPAMENGKPVTVEMNVEVDFAIY